MNSSFLFHKIVIFVRNFLNSILILLLCKQRRQINPHGVLVSTQVPSLRRVKDENRLDGGVLVLTEDL